MKLVKYEAARHALEQARNVDEVKDIRDKAVAMATYAKLAKDPELETLAKEIRLRAERRAGELLVEMGETGERVPRGGNRKSKSSTTNLNVPKLKDLGITGDQSMKWQQLAKVPERVFEEAVKEGKRPQIKKDPRKRKRIVLKGLPRGYDTAVNEAFLNLGYFVESIKDISVSKVLAKWPQNDKGEKEMDDGVREQLLKAEDWIDEMLDAFHINKGGR